MDFFPKVLAFFWKSQTFDTILETFGLVWFFMRFKKSLSWYGFDTFLVVLYLFHQCFILIQIFTLLNVALSRHPFKAYFGNKLCLHNPCFSPPPLAVFTTGKQAEFRIFLEHRYFVIKLLTNPTCYIPVSVHCTL
jgi:hypothetical protein